MNRIDMLFVAILIVLMTLLFITLFTVREQRNQIGALLDLLGRCTCPAEMEAERRISRRIYSTEPPTSSALTLIDTAWTSIRQGPM